MAHLEKDVTTARPRGDGGAGDTEQAGARLARDGFCVIRLADTTPLVKIRTRLRELLAELSGQRDVELETFHQHAPDDATHFRIQQAATERLRQERWHLDVFSANLPPFVALLGADIDVQRAPYLRFARPGRSGDNVGFHRDTVYGGSPYEVSAFIPFVDLDPGAALQVEPGSHLKSERAIPFRRTVNSDPDVTRGSAKHRLGYLYAPQVLETTYPQAFQPVPLAWGEVLVFMLALLHGSVVNSSERTRWSSDVRLKNAFAPVGARASEEIYMPLCRGPVTRAAEAYARANAEDAGS